MKVSELTGAKLDYWVGKARSIRPKWSGHLVFSPDGDVYDPSDCWAIAGPIIDEKGISVWMDEGKFLAGISLGLGFGNESAWLTADHMEYGASYLEAAMRCYVASHFGHEVPQ